MDMLEIGQYMRIAGIGLGIATAIVLVKQHPTPIILLAIGAGIYFIGDYLTRH